MNLGGKKQPVKRLDVLNSLLAIESCQAFILILNGQCNHLHSTPPGVKPNSTLEFTTHYKMRVKKTPAHKKTMGKLQESYGESQN